MHASRFLLAAVLVPAGCSADFAGVVHLTIDGPELTVGGGYWIEMRQPDGNAIDGVSRQFVEFASGSQDVAVVLERDSFFAGNDSRNIRLVVDAVRQRDAPVAARGAKLVEIDRGEVEEVTVALTDDPRPLASTLTVTVEGVTAVVDPAGLSGGEPLVFDLWVDGGEPVWLARLSGGSVSVDLGGHRGVIAENGLRMVVTAEPADSPQPLARSSGWQVLRGAMPTPLVHALVSAPYADGGIFAAMQSVLDTVEAHRGFALNDFGNDNAAGVMTHSEHVFTGVAGAIVSEDESNGTPGDLDGNGVVEYVVADRTGIGPGTPAVPGYLRRLNTALAELENVADVSNALTCAGHLADAVSETLDAATRLAEGPLQQDRADDFDFAVTRLRGDAYDPGLVSTSPAQTTRCALAVLQSLADFELTPVDAGTD